MSRMMLARFIGRDRFEAWREINSDFPPVWVIPAPTKVPELVPDRADYAAFAVERTRTFMRTPYDPFDLSRGFAYVEDGEPLHLPSRLGPTKYDERERLEHLREIKRLRAVIANAADEISAGTVGGFVRARVILENLETGP